MKKANLLHLKLPFLIVQRLGNLKQGLRGSVRKAFPIYILLSHHVFPISVLLAVSVGKSSQSQLQKSKKVRLQEWSIGSKKHCGWKRLQFWSERGWEKFICDVRRQETTVEGRKMLEKNSNSQGQVWAKRMEDEILYEDSIKDHLKSLSDCGNGLFFPPVLSK